MTRRSWLRPFVLLVVPCLAGLVAGCPGSTSSPYSPFAVPAALPSPLLGNGSVAMTVDGTMLQYDRAVFFTPGGGKIGVRPDEIGPVQRKDLFPDEVKAQGFTFRLDVPAGTTGVLNPSEQGPILEVTDRRSASPVTYRGPVTVYMQEAGPRRGFPVLGTFRGTLKAQDSSNKQLTVTDGQVHGYLATDV